MKRLLLYIFCLVAVIAVFISPGCGRPTADDRLSAVAELVKSQDFDSALVCLNNLAPEEVAPERRADYYVTAATIINAVCPECNADSLLDIGIGILKSHPNQLTMAKACYQKSILRSDENKFDEAYRWLKDAEKITDRNDGDTTRLQLRHDIFVLMSYLNNVSQNFKLAVEYGHKALLISERLGDYHRIGNDYMQLSGSYYHLQKTDSSDYYISRLQKIIDRQAERDKPDMLSNIAVNYYNKGDIAQAKNFFQRSLDLKPQAHTYYSLAQVYLKLGEKETAVELWDQALDAPEPYLRERIIRQYAVWLQEQGEYKQSVDMTRSADSLKRELDKTKQVAENILLLENNYDREEMAGRHRRQVTILTIVFFAAVLVIGGIWKWHVARTRRMNRALQEDMSGLEKEVHSKTQQLQTVSSEKEQLQKEYRSAQTELKRSQNRVESLAEKGSALHRQLMEEGNASQWNKADAQTFWEYYSIVNPAVTRQIEDEYENLSPNNKIILLLKILGDSNEEICRKLGMSEGALRTARSRINRHKRN